MYHCCSLQNKINKMPISEQKNFMWLKPAKTNSFDWMTLWKFLFLMTWFSQCETDEVGKWHCCYLQYQKSHSFELFENILHGFSSKIISETSQTPTETFLQLFEEKSIIISNISLLRLGKNMSVAMQNMRIAK